MSLVSIYIHIIASNDTRGNEAKVPPIKLERFEISEIVAIIKADNKILNIK